MKYLIFGFNVYGIFSCTEIYKENGEVHLIGKFDNGKEYTFIKHPLDIKY